MGDHSNIEWTDATWNPIVGCSILSPGCTNCYAMKMAGRLEAMGQPMYAGTTKQTKAGTVWTGRVGTSNWGQFIKPTLWKRPRKIFVNSMSDLFHEGISAEIVDQCFVVMGIADQHEYQILTKRIDRAAVHLLTSLRVEEIYTQWSSVSGSPRELASWPMRHVLIGASIEDQTRANERHHHLRELADEGWRTFVSYEPALGPVDWTGWEFISWMISGGESGAHARASHPDWHRATRDWCAANRIPYLFKQWGEHFPCEFDHRGEDGEIWRRHHDGELRWSFDELNAADPPPVTFARVGKKAAGRLLDGVEHNAFPKGDGDR